MKLVDMTVKNYLDVLKSEAPAPGGGSVSALSAAQGAGLVAMVCDLTIPKEKYAEYKELCQSVKAEILEVFDELVIGIDKDTEAYNKVSAAFKLPKGTDEEKATRSKAIQEATIIATEVPYETMELCMKGIEITAKIVGKSNPNASSDLGVAALNLLAGIKGAYLNVMINLPGIKSEEEKARFKDAEDMVKKAEVAADKIYKEVLASL
ncbi:MAG: cyclodeaminase/cyclohydrolase family protein [Firmicutes bacterium]|nr:cyclodeaminase/cyclohydrolase family protein [Bacillota bacterium]